MTDEEKQKKFEAARKLQLAKVIEREDETLNHVSSLFDEAKKEISQTLKNAPTDYQAWLLPQINNSIDGSMRELSEGLTKHVSDATRSAFEGGRDMVDLPLAAGGISLAAILPEVDTRMMMAIRSFMFDKMKSLPLDTAGKLRGSLGLVVMGVKPPFEAIADIEGLLETSRTRATTIMRTEVGRVFEVAGHERKLMASAYVPGMKKQWRRSGKLHSRQAHDLADGQIVEVEKYFTVNGKKLMHPRDPHGAASETINCGCVSVPYMEDWKVNHTGRRAFTDEELRLNPFKRDLAGALAS